MAPSVTTVRALSEFEAERLQASRLSRPALLHEGDPVLAGWLVWSNGPLNLLTERPHALRPH